MLLRHAEHGVLRCYMLCLMLHGFSARYAAMLLVCFMLFLFIISAAAAAAAYAPPAFVSPALLSPDIAYAARGHVASPRST